MIRLLRLLVFGFACGHEYKILEKITIVDNQGDKIGDQFTLQCKKCGAIKFRKSV